MTYAAVSSLFIMEVLLLLPLFTLSCFSLQAGSRPFGKIPMRNTAYLPVQNELVKDYFSGSLKKKNVDYIKPFFVLNDLNGIMQALQNFPYN